MVVRSCVSRIIIVGRLGRDTGDTPLTCTADKAGLEIVSSENEGSQPNTASTESGKGWWYVVI